MELLQWILFCIFATILLIYLYVRKAYSYWSNHGIPYVKPSFPFGNIGGAMQSEHICYMLQRFYNQMKGKGPFMGLYFLTRRAVLALDTEFIKSVLIRDFNKFTDRGIFYNEKDDPISAHLFAIDGGPWRKLRSKLTSAFTSGKMKFMYPTMLEVAERFDGILSEKIGTSSQVLELNELLGRLTTDIIGTCAFGIECNSLTDPNSKFMSMGRKTFQTPRHSPIVSIFIEYAQNWSRKLGVKQISDDVSEFFTKLVSETVEYREKNNVHRNDFMDILIKLKNEDGTLTLNEMVAQSFLFFLAGFESSSTTLTFALYELAANPAIQKHAREQIETVLEKHNGKLTYEAMMDMAYIDQIIKGILEFNSNSFK